MLRPDSVGAEWGMKKIVMYRNLQNAEFGIFSWRYCTEGLDRVDHEETYLVTNSLRVITESCYYPLVREVRR